MYGFMSGLSILFYWSMDLYFVPVPYKGTFKEAIPLRERKRERERERETDREIVCACVCKKRS